MIDFRGAEVVYGCELDGCGFFLGGWRGFGEGAAVEEGGEEFEDGGFEGGEGLAGLPFQDSLMGALG